MVTGRSYSSFREHDVDALHPGRVLAECKAKRRIMEEHAPEAGDEPCCGRCVEWEADGWEPPMMLHPCSTIRALASVYAAHPGYREEWRP